MKGMENEAGLQKEKNKIYTQEFPTSEAIIGKVHKIKYIYKVDNEDLVGKLGFIYFSQYFFVSCVGMEEKH